MCLHGMCLLPSQHNEFSHRLYLQRAAQIELGISSDTLLIFIVSISSVAEFPATTFQLDFTQQNGLCLFLLGFCPSNLRTGESEDAGWLGQNFIFPGK